MTIPHSEIIELLEGKTLATAESCTGGGIGAAITAIPGSSAVYKGGIVSYCNEIKRDLLGVDETVLSQFGAVSAPVAEAMAVGARNALHADVAVSTTGLAGPGGDEFGNPVGTVYIGYSDDKILCCEHHLFHGTREEIREQAIQAALRLIKKYNDHKEASCEKN